MLNEKNCLQLNNSCEFGFNDLTGTWSRFLPAASFCTTLWDLLSFSFHTVLWLLQTQFWCICRTPILFFEINNNKALSYSSNKDNLVWIFSTQILSSLIIVFYFNVASQKVFVLKHLLKQNFPLKISWSKQITTVMPAGKCSWLRDETYPGKARQPCNAGQCTSTWTAL